MILNSITVRENAAQSIVDFCDLKQGSVVKKSYFTQHYLARKTSKAVIFCLLSNRLYPRMATSTPLRLYIFEKGIVLENGNVVLKYF